MTIRSLLKVLGVVAVFAFLVPALAAATPLSPGVIVDVHFNSVGVPYTLGIHDSGPLEPYQGPVYADPYSLSVDGAAAILAMCFNADARVSPPSDWKALTATIDDVAQYYYGGDTEKALMLAYLNTLWPAADRQTQALVGAAMWEVTADFADSLVSLNVSSGYGNFWLLDAGAAAATQNILNAAYQQVVQGATANADIYLLPVSRWGSTPSSGTQYRSSQLYFTIDRTVQPFATDVAEPGTLTLLIVGGAGVVLARRRRLA